MGAVKVEISAGKTVEGGPRSDAELATRALHIVLSASSPRKPRVCLVSDFSETCCFGLLGELGGLGIAGISFRETMIRCRDKLLLDPNLFIRNSNRPV